jgi:hypothetical protein
MGLLYLYLMTPDPDTDTVTIGSKVGVCMQRPLYRTSSVVCLHGILWAMYGFHRQWLFPRMAVNVTVARLVLCVLAAEFPSFICVGRRGNVLY